MNSKVAVVNKNVIMGKTLPFEKLTILLTIAGPALSTDGQSSLSDLTSQI